MISIFFISISSSLENHDPNFDLGDVNENLDFGGCVPTGGSFAFVCESWFGGILGLPWDIILVYGV